MGRYAGTVRVEEPAEPKSRTLERLVGLRVDIPADGDGANFSLEYTNLRPFRAHIPLLQTGSVLNEIYYAHSLMMHRQRLKLDRGAVTAAELFHSACHPTYTQVGVDPQTYDRLLVFHFEERAPTAIRIGAMELPRVLAQLAVAITRSQH